VVIIGIFGDDKKQDERIAVLEGHIAILKVEAIDDGCTIQ